MKQPLLLFTAIGILVFQSSRAASTALLEKGAYTYDLGFTSAAAPLVAGCVALILDINPGLRIECVQLAVDIEHQFSEELEISLVSPALMESVFTKARDHAPGDTDGLKFTFLQVQFLFHLLGKGFRASENLSSSCRN